MPGRPRPETRSLSSRACGGDELLPELPEGRRDGTGREPAHRDRALLGEERYSRRVRAGWAEQQHLRLSLPLAPADEGGVGSVCPADAGQAGGVNGVLTRGIRI